MKKKLTKYDRYRLKDVEGYRKKKREWARTPDQREKRNAYMRIWREKNREQHNRLARESHQRNKHKHVDYNRDYHLRKNLGITLSDKLLMVEKQGGRCAICSEKFKSTRATHVDHCHVNMNIRGILCNVCNTKLGWYETHKASILNYLVNQ